MLGAGTRIALVVSIVATVKSIACESTLTLEGSVARLREREQPVRAYVEALDALGRLREQHGPSVDQAVRTGLGGDWSPEARWTLFQNPRLYRLFFP